MSSLDITGDCRACLCFRSPIMKRELSLLSFLKGVNAQRHKWRAPAKKAGKNVFVTVEYGRIRIGFSVGLVVNIRSKMYC